ncbi:hypothetical protein MN608_10455 [Microdochium nivale]|nr:hypothetical protein MN608_10455 [Microdochium nivale]
MAPRGKSREADRPKQTRGTAAVTKSRTTRPRKAKTARKRETESPVTELDIPASPATPIKRKRRAPRPRNVLNPPITPLKKTSSRTAIHAEVYNSIQPHSGRIAPNLEQQAGNSSTQRARAIDSEEVQDVNDVDFDLVRGFEPIYAGREAPFAPPGPFINLRHDGLPGAP